MSDNYLKDLFIDEVKGALKGDGSVDPETLVGIIEDYLEQHQISSDIPKVDHGTADTTFQLPPNEIHKWGEVTSLTLTLGPETTGVENVYVFRFESGDTATVLSLPDTVKTDIVVSPNTLYECSISDGLMSFDEWEVSA